MSGGGSSIVPYRNAALGLGESFANVSTLGGYNKVRGRHTGYGEDIANTLTAGLAGAGEEYLEDKMKPPDPTAPPTMEDIAAKEPDKERRRRQRMAALMAQGRQGTILTGSGGMTPNNTIGGGGKQMVGA